MFHLSVAMGGVLGTAHVFYLKWDAYGLKFAFEVCPVVYPDFGGIPKNLKNFFFYCICNRLAAFVFDQSQHAQFTETANGT
jgi:hypothetical protein